MLARRFASLAGFAALAAGCTITSGSPSASGPLLECVRDPAAGCVTDAIGYACTGSATPDDTDSSLACSTGVPGTNGDTIYCCRAGAPSPSPGPSPSPSPGPTPTPTPTPTPAPTSTCAPDPNVVGCASANDGYACTGSDTPDESDPSLTCGPGTPSNGATLFCCTSGTPSSASPTSTCAPAAGASVFGCAGKSVLYACASTDTPAQSDPSLACSAPIVASTGTQYCCTPFASTACATAPVPDCNGPSYGFACSGAATPAQTDPSLTCSEGSPGADGSTLYCCTDLGQ